MWTQIKLGKEKKFTCYGWNGEEWKEYEMIEMKLHQSISNPSQLELTIIGALDDEDDDILKKDGKIAICIGTALIDKFDIDTAEKTTDYKRKIIGYSASGSKGLRKLLRETVGEKSYTDATVSDVISYIADSNNILEIDSNDNGGSDKINISFRYDKRVNALSKLCEKTGKEWWISYDGIMYLPPNEGEDTLHIADYKPDSTRANNSQYTFYITGYNTNAYYSGNKDTNIDKVNHVRIIGYGGMGTSTLEVEHFNATTITSYLANALDTYLDEDISDTDTTITVKDASVLPSSGRVRIDNEYIDYTGKSGNDLTGCTRGAAGSTASVHSEGAEVLNYGTDGTDIQITVEDASGFVNSANSKIRVGSEVFKYSSILGNTLTGCSRGQTDEDGNTTVPYSHSKGTKVYQYYRNDTSTWYTRTSPQSGSDISNDGIHSKTYSDEESIYRDELDKKAVYLLENYNTVRNISIKVADPFEVFDEQGILLGDRVKIIDANSGLNSEFRIIEITHRYKYGLIESELVLSHKRTVYSLGLKEGTTYDYTRPTKSLEQKIDRWSDDDGSNLTINPSGEIELRTTKDIEIYSDATIDLHAEEEVRIYCDEALFWASSVSICDITIHENDPVWWGAMEANHNLLIKAKGDIKLYSSTDDDIILVADYVALEDGTRLAIYNSDNSRYIEIGHTGTPSHTYISVPVGYLNIDVADDINISTGDDVEIEIGSSADYYFAVLSSSTAFKVYGDTTARFYDDLRVDDNLDVGQDLDVGWDLYVDMDGTIDGDLTVTGHLTKGSGSFRIDHPLDPKNKILNHSFVEAPEYLNIYRGKAYCNKEAEVKLPDYFWALNKDITLQVTPINTFTLATYRVDLKRKKIYILTEKPCEVSYVIYGIRKDRYALANPLRVEEKKERPGYIHPDVFEDGDKVGKYRPAKLAKKLLEKKLRREKYLKADLKAEEKIKRARGKSENEKD